MGADDEPGDVEADWLGVDMYFSHFGARRTGGSSSAPDSSSIARTCAVEPEDRHDARFLWVVARAPAGD